MTNTAAILALADFIERHTELPFDMASGKSPHSCGTAGCIGGFAAVLWPKLWRWDSVEFDDAMLCERLGVGEGSRLSLLFPGDSGDYNFHDSDEPIRYSRITRLGAAATLRHLAATGQVRWLKSEQRST